jgi:hypothetical protein
LGCFSLCHTKSYSWKNKTQGVFKIDRIFILYRINKKQQTMIKAFQLLDAVKTMELAPPNKKDAMKPTQPLRFQLGSTEKQEYLKTTFGLSEFEKDKDMKTLTVNVSSDLAGVLDKMDKAIQKKASKLAKPDGLEWKSLVTQEGKYEPQIKVKLYCKQSAPTRTRFYTWDGQEMKEGKPVLEPTSVDHICAGQRVVLHLSLGQVYTFKGTRGVTLYAKHVLIIGEEEDGDVDFS